MQELRARGLVETVLAFARSGRPLLGICIGMQLLFDQSEEHGLHQGLGLLPGRVVRFDDALPVPHMGWNRLRRTQEHPLTAALEPGDCVYFVHSYRCMAAPPDVLATSDYGPEFPAVVGRGNVLGVQFHPEKSQAVGLRMVVAFADMVHGDPS
jgi:glutamine amidotransferase